MDADPTGTSIISSLLLLLFFTLMNAFFAGAEMAVVSVNKNRIRSLAEDGNKKAKVIEKLFDDSTKFLSTIQVAITFAGFYSSASAAARIAPVLGAWLASRGLPYAEAIASNGVTLLLMFFNLVFGELVPKRIALQKAEAFCMLTVMPVHYISIVLSPFIKLLSVSTKVVLKLLGFKTTDQEEAVTEEEIKALLKQGSETGLFEDEERKMIDSVFAFNDRTAREIRVPRRDVVSFDINEPFDTLLDDILETRHNRIPVYDDDIDNIIGVLHIKDVMIELRKDIRPEDLDIRAMLHEPFFVPETKTTDSLFRDMQAQPPATWRSWWTSTGASPASSPSRTWWKPSWATSTRNTTTLRQRSRPSAPTSICLTADCSSTISTKSWNSPSKARTATPFPATSSNSSATFRRKARASASPSITSPFSPRTCATIASPACA